MDKINFRYKARDQNGHLVEGRVESSDLDSAKAYIGEQNLLLVSIQKDTGFTLDSQQFKELFAFKKTSISFDEMILFNHQLQITYSAGLPLLTSLEMIEQEVDNDHLKKAVKEIAKDVREGETLSDSLGSHTDFFDPIALQLIKAGEASGRLDYFLEQVINMVELRNRNKEKFKSATLYPKILLGISGFVFLVIFGFVMPQMKSLFADMGAELPLVTQIVVAMSDFIVEYWLKIFGGVTFSFFGFKYFFMTPKGTWLKHKWTLKMPLFGNLLTMIEMSTFSKVLNTLLESGIPALESTELASETLNNSVIKKDVMEAREKLRRGGTFAEAFGDAESVPRFVVNFMRIGEESGKLSLILERISKYYEIQIERKMETLGKVIEPLMMVFIFGMVFLVVLAVYLPIWKLNNLV